MSDSNLPHMREVDSELVIGAVQTALTERALRAGGGCLKKFAQGNKDTLKGLGFYYKRYGWNGICYALSLFWMALHANEIDFWHWLAGGPEKSTPSRRFLRGPANEIIALHGALNSFAFSGGRQTAKQLRVTRNVYAEHWMRGAGLNEMNYMNWLEASIAAEEELLNAVALKDMVGGQNRGTGFYKQIIFRSPGSGHSCAAWVGTDVCFFDPNYGEFWFPSAEKFKEWFRFFLGRSGYRKRYATYEIIAFSPAYKRT